SGTLQTMSVPDDYRSGDPDIPFTLVHRDLHQPGVYRVLTQRGCSFGGCRFCTQIDRMIHFPFSIQEVTRQLEEELRNNPPQGPISISIDNDEMTPPDLLYLVDFFESMPYEFNKVTFWYQVKLFNPSIAAGLRKVKNPGIYHFQMNWESMNPKTLKFMSKGHDPLKAIEAAKSVLDVGASFGSNYMCRFPRQDHENVAKEADFLAAAFHLGVGRMAVFSYSANGRDMISGSPERYQIEVTRNPANVWAKETFGTDLDISFWQYDWEATQGTTDRVDYWLAKLYGRIFSKVSYDATWRAALSHFPLAVVSVLSGRMGYIKRSWALFNIMRRNQTNGGFRVENNRLIRRTRIFGLTRTLDVKLSDQDVSLLRHVYLTTRDNDLDEWLSKRMSESAAAALLRRHEKLGTIVRMDGKVISVVQDPEYWSRRLASEQEAAVDTTLAVNYS
ncbi:MAG: radical SAM protein, partial [Gammaproteobacteria bacterium]|nr:radical SAM protein [Gammaproteobacteria bacterium]